jgi:hypothetical protein
MYYRVAIQMDALPTWQWKSKTISSLPSLLQFLRRFHDLPQDHLRVFSSYSREEFGEQLGRENNGLGSDSVTVAQFLQERMLGSQHGTSTTPSTGQTLNGTNAHNKTAVSSPESRKIGQEHAVNRVGFWNIMALVEA